MKLSVVTVVGALAWLAATVTPASAAEDPIDVWVSILPQVEMVDRIGGDHVTVRALVQPGDSPTTYEPTPRQLAALWDSDLVLVVGVPFEATLFAKIGGISPQLHVVDAARGIDLQPIEDHAHHHGGSAHLDPHTWLDPELVKIHVANIAEALCETAPQHCETFTRNRTAYDEDLQRVDDEIRRVLGPYRGRHLLVFHPSFGYFSRRYGLHQVAVETGGKTPSPRQLAELVEAAETSDVGAVFVQPQFTDSAAQAVAEAVGGRLVELDPLAPDLLANLERMATTIAAQYRE
jgi:zinc transport system substrate-binding protein